VTLRPSTPNYGYCGGLLGLSTNDIDDLHAQGVL
jgi:hypothetical protein